MKRRIYKIYMFAFFGPLILADAVAWLIMKGHDALYDWADLDDFPTQPPTTKEKNE